VLESGECLAQEGRLRVDSGAGFLLYVSLKYASYAAWCYLGLRLVRAAGSNLIRPALGFGFVRLLIGVGFGLAIFFVGGMMHLNVPANPWAYYFGVYAPVRWVEWSILAALLVRGNSFARFLVGGGSGVIRWWQLGGVVVSHFADLPLVISSHGVTDMLPVGRFLR
jgi:hypothetical protein